MLYHAKQFMLHQIHRRGYRILKTGAAGVQIAHATRLKHQAEFVRCYDRIRNIPGDIVECGVNYGRSLLYLATLMQDDPRQRILWGYDSWRGLPPPGAVDGPLAWTRMESFKDSAPDMVRQYLFAHGISRDWISRSLRLIPGDFEDTLRDPNVPPAIALLHLDGDLYDSHVVALTRLWPAVQPGGLVKLDDARNPKWPGAQQAVDEFCGRTPAAQFVYEPLTRGTILKVGGERKEIKCSG